MSMTSKLKWQIIRKIMKMRYDTYKMIRCAHLKSFIECRKGYSILSHLMNFATLIGMHYNRLYNYYIILCEKAIHAECIMCINDCVSSWWTHTFYLIILHMQSYGRSNTKIILHDAIKTKTCSMHMRRRVSVH